MWHEMALSPPARPALCQSGHGIKAGFYKVKQTRVSPGVSLQLKYVTLSPRVIITQHAERGNLRGYIRFKGHLGYVRMADECLGFVGVAFVFPWRGVLAQGTKQCMGAGAGEGGGGYLIWRVGGSEVKIKHFSA